jgi:hypothetical protein
LGTEWATNIIESSHITKKREAIVHKLTPFPPIKPEVGGMPIPHLMSTPTLKMCLILWRILQKGEPPLACARKYILVIRIFVLNKLSPQRLINMVEHPDPYEE